MKVIVQRVNKSIIYSEGKKVGEIGYGLCVYLGIKDDDTLEKADFMCDKLKKLRIFPDCDGKINLNTTDAGGNIMVVSNFTIYGDCSRNNRPSFSHGASADVARPIYNHFVEQLKIITGLDIQTGVFQTHMHIETDLDGPINLIIEI